MRKIILLLVVAVTVGSACRSPSPEAVVRDFFASMNDHDVDRALASLHADYVFRDAGGTFAVPRESVRPLFEWDAAVRARSKATILEVEGDTVAVRLRETNDFLELLEVAPWTHEVELVVRDGAIAATIVDDAAELAARVDRALDPVIEWARATRPGDLEGLVTEHGLVYDGDTARRWIALLREARASGVIGSGGTTP